MGVFAQARRRGHGEGVHPGGHLDGPRAPAQVSGRLSAAPFQRVVLVEVAQAFPVRRQGLFVSHLGQSGLRDHPGAGTDEVEHLNGHSWAPSRMNGTLPERNSCPLPQECLVR
jgi:hypothetical protein